MSAPISFLNGRVSLYGGDCRDVLKSLPDCSIDSVVTDPPYGLGFMGRAWDAKDGAPFATELWAEVFRVLKPGGHVAAFSGTRTYHRMAVAIEDAGFEIRDQIGWAYGSGFPKSHNISKAIDKVAGIEGEQVAKGSAVKRIIPGADQAKQGWEKTNGREYQPHEYVPGSESARQWNGWGTALKPAWEPICLARKPLIGTVAKNVLAHGTGALNIDGCRVETDKLTARNNANTATFYKLGLEGVPLTTNPSPLGRWPANLIHDGSDEVVALFPETTSGTGAVKKESAGDAGGNSGSAFGAESRPAGTPMICIGDSGSAARFFYTAKADSSDRLGSKHPTVKPIDLMQWLCRLITPPGGTVLDPFAGTGTTGEAAWREGMKAVLIEREDEYQADIARRMDLAEKPEKRAAVAKTKNHIDDLGPLFAGPLETGAA